MSHVKIHVFILNLLELSGQGNPGNRPQGSPKLFRTTAGNKYARKIHVLNYIWPPTEKPHNRHCLYIAAGHRYFNSQYKNNTPATGTGGTHTKRSAIMSLKFQWTQPGTGLAEPT